MSFFGDVSFEDFLTEELKTLFDHFFGWVEYIFKFLEKFQDFMIENVRIFAALNHCDEVSAKEIGLGFLVKSDNKFKGFLNELPETRVG